MADNETGVSPNTPMQDLIGQMNYQAATSAAGLNLSKQMNNMLAAVNMNVGKVNASVTKVDGTLNKMYDMSKSINMNIGKVNANITALGKRHDDTNKILSDILKGIGGKPGGVNVYENVENKMEQKDVSSNIQIMTDTLKSIDETLKALSKTSGSPTNPAPQNTGGSGSLGTMGGIAAWEAAKRFAGSRLGTAALTGAAIYGGDAALGYATGIGQNKIDYNQDERNWSRMNWMNKVESSTARGIEYVGSWFAPNMTNEAAAARIRDETTYLDGKENASKAAAASAYAGSKARFLKNASSADGPVWQRYGRVGPNTTAMDMAVAGDLMNKHANDGPLQAYNGFGSRIAAFPQVPLSTNTERLSYNAKGYGDDTLPYAPTSNDGLILGSMETKADLDQQQANIEKQAKNITKSELLYEATDVVYKATNIRFEASNIQFMGGGMGGSSSGSGLSGSQRYTGSQSPYDNGGGPGGNLYSEPKLSTEQQKTFDAIQSGSPQSYSGNQTSPFSGLSQSDLQNAGIKRVEGRGPSGLTTYEALPLSPDEAKSAILNQGTKSSSAREAAEKYIGRKLSDEEYDYLIRATHAEAGAGKGASQQEQAMVMASILNRAKDMGPNGVIKALKANNQFQSVTGTKYNPGPSQNFTQGPNAPRLSSIESAAVDYLPNVSPDQKNFTAAADGAYGPGTNRGYRDNMLAQGGSVVGGSVFNTTAPEKYQGSDDKSFSVLKSRLQSGDIAPESAVAIAKSMGINNKAGREQNLIKSLNNNSVQGDFKGMDPNTVIDKNSPVWNMVHPDLKRYQNEVLGGNGSGTGKITLGALIAADAVFKQAGKEGVKMRVAVGGGSNQHSQNHGRLASGIGESIDIKPVDGWQPGQAERYGVIAGKAGANRIGIPTNSSGLHVQDSIPKNLGGSGAPDMSWGYGPQGYLYGRGSDFRKKWIQGDIRQPDVTTENVVPIQTSSEETNDSHESKPDIVTSRNQQAIKRTESLRREEARRNNREAEESKRSRDKGKAAEAKKESHEPRNPHSSSRKQMDSVLVRHNDWWKNWSATA